MRILFLTHRTTDTQIGGLAEYLYYLPIYLKQLGIESILYSQSDNKNVDLEGPISLNNGIDSYSGPFVKPSFWVCNKQMRALLQLCKTEKIDLIHAQGLYRSGFMAMQANKLIQIPFVVTSHSDINQTSDRIKRPSVLKRCQKVLSKATGVTHLTPQMAKNSHAILDTAAKSALIGNGIDLSTLEPLAREFVEKDYILSLGRMVPEKGFDILIRAYADLVKQGYMGSLVLAGAGPEEVALKQLTERLGLKVVEMLPQTSFSPSTVFFTGYIRGAMKNELLAHSKIILFATQPSQFEEAFPIIALESIGVGKPLIASDVPAMNFLTEQGFKLKLVEPTNQLMWTEAIKALLDDAALRRSIAENYLERAGQFDWRNIAKQYADFYRKCLSVCSK